PRHLDCRLDLHKQFGHLRRPALLIALLNELQFPQVMGITETMSTVWICETLSASGRAPLSLPVRAKSRWPLELLRRASHAQRTRLTAQCWPSGATAACLPPADRSHQSGPLALLCATGTSPAHGQASQPLPSPWGPRPSCPHPPYARRDRRKSHSSVPRG